MTEPANILAVESSCDETACAVVADGRSVLSDVVASQIDIHARYGGVVPEIASRAHIEAVNTVIAQAVNDAGLRPLGPLGGAGDISAVAVTNEPGLIGSLLVGLMAAKTLAWTYDVPLIGVNHIYAHAYAPALDSEPIEYPAAALICSGGHTALYHCRAATEMELLGSTIDDAAGEAFDKVASILNLGYPGGPVIDRIAPNGNAQAVDFPRSLLKGRSLDFSFSGLKTAVLYHVNGVPGAKDNRGPAGDQAAPKHGIENFSKAEIVDIAASFQAAVVDVLRIKLRRAAEHTGVRTLVIGGGVSANTALRAAVADLADELGCTLRMPAARYCLDNAAMVGGLAWHYLAQGMVAGLDLDAHATIRR